MKNPRKYTSAALLVGSLFAASAASAAIYTLPDQTFLADNAGGAYPGTSVAFDFGNEAWSGTLPNRIENESSLYLTTTVSWNAFTNADPTVPTTDIGVFRMVFTAGDDGGGGQRLGFTTVANNGTNTGGIGINGNSYTAADPDGDGPATAGPGITAINKSTTTSMTLVLKVDQVKGATSPGGDWWFTDTTQQTGAAHFLWIDPDFGATEASQPTPLAAWRSSNTSYGSLLFQYNTNQSDMTFSNIAIYTGDDSPFAPIPEPSSALLGALGLLALLRRRRA